MTCAISTPRIRQKLTSPKFTKPLSALFVTALAAVVYQAYVIFTLTHESFNLPFGLLISATVFLGIALLSGNIKWLSTLLLKKRVIRYSGSLAAFSYTLFLIHYPLILFLNGLNFEIDRLLLFVPIILLINEIAFCLAAIGEKKRRQIAGKINALFYITK
jgi:peptidoglycan/LPS O-acetylase OafA/YrhL